MTTSNEGGGWLARAMDKWPQLTRDELEATDGDREQLIALLQGRIGYARENAEGDVDDVLTGDIATP